MAAFSSSACASDPLAPWLARHLDVRLVARSPVGGGCIHSAWSLTLADGGRLFAKSGPLAALTLLEAEADGLVALAAAADPQRLVVPVPLALGQVEEQAVLVLPWLDLGSSGGQGDPWRRLGASLAALHRRSLEGPLVAGDRGGLAFGWGRDNHIGSTSQANGWLEDWGRFFVERRLGPQVDRFVRREGPLPGASALLERVPQWLAAHSPEPCLVHGDLWSGNAGHLGDGRGTLFDPSVHRADREVDLAMARLFGGFPHAFFAGYETAWPLPAGHEHRRDFYNLYHLLNHANLFGGSYGERSRRLIGGLLQRDGGGG
jgi:fructosamine-3-kinase